MRLSRLTGLEQDKIIGEYKEVMAEIADLLSILATPTRVTTIIGEELAALKQEFGQTKVGARRSTIEKNATDLETEDLITPTDVVVTLSHTGYIKSQVLSEYRAQRRGGPRQAGDADQGRRLGRAALHRQHARLDPLLHHPWAGSTG
jgi:DNA gyrase subunit A